MSVQGWQRVLVAALLLTGGPAATMTPRAWGQAVNSRKIKNKVAPAYPELARRMRIAGIVKVQATVAPNGTVEDVKLVGGHPVLANAVLEAVKKWRYEASPQETTESLQFAFDPNQ